jgi:hypothetical protein
MNKKRKVENLVPFERGEFNPNAKLTADQVSEIKLKLRQGLGFIELASLYGVSQFCIRKIADRKTWKHVK